MRSEFILRKALDIVGKENSLKLLKDLAFEFGKKLKDMGWTEYVMGGEYYSPDCSTVFFYNRSPYYCQFTQGKQDAEKEFNDIIKSFGQDIATKEEYMLKIEKLNNHFRRNK